ncbi:uncharacterized protein A1O5_06201 [Cladophialophora psammophila CBS 110553]|uniref:Uncharacterized protein n=1 Tax=Cladophialophora psammophila CBS 110553 TaxID=1182543 RepID=W9WSM2_9EURO|nr:uncharacterized protein A1O5_06201 [Cladophialophora psammophila CBS 110553]EXJ71207.1 hypothetical protein A1O5_06201 [Cladophialophora psammophila CBS 110553]
MGDPSSPSQLEQAGLKDIDAAAIQLKYNQEREKRLRPDGLAQFIDLHALPKFRHFKADLWIEEDARPLGPTPPQDGSRCEILIIGAGWSGLVFAVRLLQAGFKLEDIRIVDYAGGFGGTWYWNRYPGLFCDIESYIYMPLLEETGYMPTQKYASGEELRGHAERIARKWKLDENAWLRQRVTSLEWDDNAKEWSTRLVPQLEPGKEGNPITVHSRFVVLATGLTFFPHIPQVPGIEKFKGACFHTARWDYHSTGGTSTKPEMLKLRDKRVGVIGTGATAMQVVPSLVQWSKELYVFQRTPSSVDRRDNRPTDPEWARTINSKPGWQKERIENFHRFVTNAPEKPPVDMVSDGWTRMPSYSALTGTTGLNCRTPEEAQKHIEELHALDLPRQEGIRKRVDEIVTDPSTAEKLKPWYPGWCKRPCFHDEYLQSFNEQHVKLVDTNGLGIKEITEDGVLVGDKEYKIDTLILSTGYRSLFLLSPGGRVDIDIKGRNGLSLDKKWTEGVATLHGMMSHGFPNLFWPGLIQAGGSPNFSFSVDLSATHISEILSYASATKRVNGEDRYNPDKYKNHFTIEPTLEAEEEWSQLIASQAGAFAAVAGCTPNYFNAEGELARPASPKEQAKRARLSLWAKGPEDFARIVTEWRASKDFKGLEIASTN